MKRRAANGYVVWPLAILDFFREPDDATAWSRLHTRQAFVFGIVAALAYAIVLALPFVAVVAFSGLSITAIVWLYVAGMLADLAGAIVLIAASFGYRARALRGELFAVPLVSVLADRFLRLER